MTILEKAWYKLNETSGTIAIDSSGNGNDGTNNGATVNQTGKIGKAYSFDGSNDYISTSVNSSNNDFSISGWIYNTYNKNSVILSEWKSSNHNRFRIYWYNTYKLSFDMYDSSTTISLQSSALSLNTWYHFIATFDYSTKTMKLYINGSYISSTTNTSIITTFENDFYLSCFSDNTATSQNFDGKLDDVRIYDFVLDSTDVELIYNNNNGTEVDLYTLRNPPTSNNNFFSMSLGAEF